jgi:hypothetical protein
MSVNPKEFLFFPNIQYNKFWDFFSGTKNALPFQNGKKENQRLFKHRSICLEHSDIHQIPLDNFRGFNRRFMHYPRQFPLLNGLHISSKLAKNLFLVKIEWVEELGEEIYAWMADAH